MLSVPLAEAKNRLSELILRAESGEDVAITKRGKPMVRLVPVAESALDRQAEVAEVFRRLSLLSRGMRLEGDLKAVAREGLD
ncbi:MAG: type II toxin-antitoxin system prevent-host-death family antitoxin [Proteobacteria bacterium]|jgi:prevent-host-death family protein|nr:type II toxin-antitoxin system prevent-host-death family antitoxin [Pseudomonadota bacterium]